MLTSYRLKLRRSSIGYKIFFSMVLLTIGSLLMIVFIVNSTYRDSMRQNEIKYNILATNTIQSKFDMSIELIQSTAQMLESNSSVENLLRQGKEDPSTIENVEALVKNSLTTQPFIEQIHILSKQELVFSSQVKSKWDSIWASNHNLWETPRSKDHTTGYWTNRGIAISYVQPVVFYASNPVGIVVIDISYDYLREMFMLSAIGLNEKVLVVNSVGEVLFNYPHSTSFEPFLNQYPQLLEQDSLQLEGEVYGIDSVIVAEKLHLADWRIIRIIQTADITSQTSLVIHTLQIAIMLLVLACLGYSFWFTRSVTRPIQALNNACIEAEQGNMQVRVDIASRDEFGRLGQTFNMMLSHLQENLKAEIENQKRKSEMQFQILQAQINPHFLYNTLDSIRWLATMKGVNNIAEMSGSLISLLKYNLSSSDATTTLQEELDSVQNYITIQKFRYSDNFDFSIQADESVRQCEIIRFLLQPLVENSIIHGFEEMQEGYYIRIHAFVEQDKLHIQVIDNGSGMDPKRTEELNTNRRNRQRFSHIGVANIRERIQLHFGAGYDVSYTSQYKQGTTAEMVLPALYKKPETEDAGPGPSIGEPENNL